MDFILWQAIYVAEENRGVIDMRDFFTNWNYKKHAKFCTAVYLGLYAIDMTVSYFIVKRILDRIDELEEN